MQGEVRRLVCRATTVRQIFLFAHAALNSHDVSYRADSLEGDGGCVKPKPYPLTPLHLPGLNIPDGKGCVKAECTFERQSFSGYKGDRQERLSYQVAFQRGPPDITMTMKHSMILVDPEETRPTETFSSRGGERPARRDRASKVRN